jgi:hypothetical protein
MCCPHFGNVYAMRFYDPECGVPNNYKGPLFPDSVTFYPSRQTELPPITM